MMSSKSTFILVLSLLSVEVIPIQLQQGEQIDNDVDDSQLNECVSIQRSSELGVCFGKEVLNRLNKYDETESFSLATGISFVRDEKTPRDIGSFLDKDPMDFRSIIEDASHLISKRSLHWDMSMLYPGLVMRIGPTLANGVLEFVLDPKVKDRSYSHNQHHQENGGLSTGRLLARNLLVPFLLGFKFQISTLLPILLGLVLIASKKAFLLAKIALLAVTVFSGGFGQSSGGFGGFGGYPPPALSGAYSSYDHAGYHHDPHISGGYYNRHHHQTDPYYREKSADQTTAAPITPDELRDRLERFFVTKKEGDEIREETKIRNARNFAWTPING